MTHRRKWLVKEVTGFRPNDCLWVRLPAEPGEATTAVTVPESLPDDVVPLLHVRAFKGVGLRSHDRDLPVSRSVAQNMFDHGGEFGVPCRVTSISNVNRDRHKHSLLPHQPCPL